MANGQRVMGVLCVMAGAGLAVIKAGHPTAGSVAWAVVVLLAVGGGGLLLGRPLVAGLVALASVGVALLTGPVTWPPGHALTAAILLAVLASGTAWIRHYDPGLDVGPADGIVAVGLMLLTGLILGTLAPVPRPGPAYHRPGVVLLLYLLTPPLELLAAFAVLSRRGRLSRFLRSRYGWTPGLPTGLGIGLMAGVALVLIASLTVLIESALGMKVVTNNPFVYSPHLSHQAPAWAVAALIVAVVALAPLAEELLFRGLLFGGLASRWGFWPAALGSAAVFGAAHLDLSLFLGLFLAGLALNTLYWRHRSLWVSTVTHATLNGISVLLALLVR